MNKKILSLSLYPKAHPFNQSMASDNTVCMYVLQRSQRYITFSFKWHCLLAGNDDNKRSAYLSQRPER